MIIVPEKAVEAARSWRERIHRHPELGYVEDDTSAAAAGYLESLGWSVRTGFARTGVLAQLPGTAAGPRILLRAEMDALPVQEETGAAFTSEVPGVAHACGHDAHAAILLGFAAALSEGGFPHPEVGLFFQPAEELLGGGRQSIEEGLWEAYDARACFALHGWPALPAGTFGLLEGPCMAAIDICRLRVCGKAGHGAMPHETIDPIVAASELVVCLQSIVSREIDPMEPAVLTFGRISGGSADNAVASSVTLEGTLRYHRPEVGGRIIKGIHDRAAGIDLAFGTKTEVVISPCYPPTINHEGAVRWLDKLITGEFGGESVRGLRPAMASEDFSFYLRDRPGAMVFMGTGGEYPLHHSGYLFPGELLERGIRLYLAICAALAGGTSFLPSS